MKRAGCVSIVVGIESGSPRILSKISKGISVEQCLAFCRSAADSGILIAPYFMYSLPGETRQDVEKTLDLIEELEKFTQPCSFQPCMILPGTEIERISRSKGILPPAFSWYDPYESSVNVKLGQLANIPLFVDGLTVHDMRQLVKRLQRRRDPERDPEIYRRNIRAFANVTAEKTFTQMLIKASKLLLSRILAGKPLPKYVFSPRFYSDLIYAKLRKRNVKNE
jgi:hypothetical protein